MTSIVAGLMGLMIAVSAIVAFVAHQQSGFGGAGDYPGLTTALGEAAATAEEGGAVVRANMQDLEVERLFNAKDAIPVGRCNKLTLA